MQPFITRRQAGRVLANRLLHLANREDVVVIALPRGGVPVAFEVARALGVALDVMVARKLGAPDQPELAIGAIAGETIVLDQRRMRAVGASRTAVELVLAAEEQEQRRREERYRHARHAIPLAGRTVLLVDDGVATGATMMAALAETHRQQAAAVIVAVPVASREAVAALSASGATVIAVTTPEPFGSVGRWYESFEPTSDAEVTTLLAAGAKHPEARRLPAADRPPDGRPTPARRIRRAS